MINKALFLRYALPCADKLIERGETTKEYIEEIKRCLRNRERIKNEYLKIFKVAFAFCEELGKKLKKNAMDEEIIRKYFWFEHDKIVDLTGACIECKILPGRVEKISNNKAIVMTPIGKKTCSLELAEEIKKGDYVTLHLNFVIEKISRKNAKTLWKIKEALI